MTFALGLAGLVSTLIASLLGLYYTHKARSATYREFLYTKQIEFIVECFDRVNVLQSLAVIIETTTEEPDRQQIWEELQGEIVRFASIANKAAAILPTELFSALSGFSSACTEFLLKAAKEKELTEAVHTIQGQNMRFGLLAREFMGIDALSEESMKLFSKQNLNQVLSIPRSEWLGIAKDVSERTLKVKKQK